MGLVGGRICRLRIRPRHGSGLGGGSGGEVGEGVVAGHFDADEGGVGLGDLGHFGFDALEIVGADGVVQVDVVVETAFDGGSIDEFGLGPEAADGFGHDAGAGVPMGVAGGVFGWRGRGCGGIIVGLPVVHHRIGCGGSSGACTARISTRSWA